MFSSFKKKTDEKEKTPQPPCYFYTHHWTYLETKYTSSTKISTFVTFTMNWNIEHIFWKIFSKDHINMGFLTENIMAKAYWEKNIFELFTAKNQLFYQIRFGWKNLVPIFLFNTVFNFLFSYCFCVRHICTIYCKTFQCVTFQKKIAEPVHLRWKFLQQYSYRNSTQKCFVTTFLDVRYV